MATWISYQPFGNLKERPGTVAVRLVAQMEPIGRRNAIHARNRRLIGFEPCRFLAVVLLAWATAARGGQVTPLKFFPDQANVIDLAPVDAQFVRLNLSQSSSGVGIALDEVEVFAPGQDG